ncbi:MAG: HRDC domain-containing protein [Thermoleophilia bacterium]|nr:HRDC domain-containing protein [Thermoleophilia bacterium]
MDFVMLDSSAALADLCEEARASGRLGLDTEFLWERTYSPQICLAQVNVDNRVYLADPLDGVDLQPISELISDPAVEVVMHAPHADLVAFALRHGAEPVNTFDTQVTAGFTGLSAGLAYEKLVYEVTRQKVQPSESFSDWSRRPLQDKQLQYAGEDVEHLFNMRDTLVAKLQELGREEWAREELTRRFDGVEHFMTAPDEAWRKVGRRGKLGPGDLAVLREVAAWRENLARSRDLPVGWVAKDPTMIEIARRQPASQRDLVRVRGVDGSMKAREQSELLAAIERGRSAEPILEEGAAPIRGVRRRIAVAKGLATALLRARCEAEEIASELVGTSSDVEELIGWIAGGKTDASAPFLLRGWREPFGLDLVDLVDGRIQLQLVDDDPYLVIHRVE